MKSLFAVLVTAVALALVEPAARDSGSSSASQATQGRAGQSDTATLDTSDGGFAGATTQLRKPTALR